MPIFDLTHLPEWTRTGGLSRTDKMPAFSYGLPATACLLGQRLRLQPDTVCAACYALRGRYRFPAVRAAQARRLAAVRSSPTWVADMTRLLTLASGLVPGDAQVFRWHDSGDVQSLAHLRQIVAICRATSTLRHWLPTRELGFVASMLDTDGPFPPNLVVRVSATSPDEPAPPGPWQTGTVHAIRPPLGQPCAAPSHGHQCGACRACWDPAIPNISYPLR